MNERFEIKPKLLISVGSEPGFLRKGVTGQGGPFHSGEKPG